ncbi:MAG: DNA repair protein [Ruminococcus sp.]|nr:DNA repair protein [Ruminococcus sp.]
MNRKLRRMRKIELLELLLEQEKEIETLRTENERLQKENDIQRLKIENAGSIAEASLQLSGIFEAAQKAADLYLRSVRPDLEEAENVEEIQTGTETVGS